MILRYIDIYKRIIYIYIYMIPARGPQTVLLATKTRNQSKQSKLSNNTKQSKHAIKASSPCNHSKQTKQTKHANKANKACNQSKQAKQGIKASNQSMQSKQASKGKPIGTQGGNP